MRNRTIIKTDEQIQNCLSTKMEVEVWFGGVLDCISEIKEFDEDVIVVGGGKFLRRNCILKIKGSHLKLVSKN